QQRQEPPGHFFTWLFGLAATENTRRGGLVGIVEDPGHWWGGGIVGPVLDRLLEFVMLGPALAVKPVFDIARRAIVERRTRAVDELADLVFGLVVQLSGAFSIGAIGFRDQFLPLPGDHREQLPIAPGHFCQVGGRLAR